MRLAIQYGMNTNTDGRDGGRESDLCSVCAPYVRGLMLQVGQAIPLAALCTRCKRIAQHVPGVTVIAIGPDGTEYGYRMASGWQWDAMAGDFVVGTYGTRRDACTYLGRYIADFAPDVRVWFMPYDPRG